MKLLKNILVSVVVLALVAVLLAWGVKESKAEAAKQNEATAAWRALFSTVQEQTCVVDATATEEWMKNITCSERIKSLVRYYDVVGSYPTDYEYRMRDGRMGKVPATKLFYRMRMVY